MTLRRIVPLVFFLILCSFLLVPSVLAQTETATLSGQITDPQGRVVPGVDVQIINIDTNTTVHETTNEVGLYVAVALRPGRYRLAITKEGFRRIDVAGLVLNVQDMLSRNFQLQLGPVQSSITVVADEAKINTETGTVSTLVDRQFVGNLPLNGRSFQSLILLTPGVVVTTANVNTEFGQFSVDGQRASTNYFMVDGVSANIGEIAITGDAANIAVAGSYPALGAVGGTNGLVSVDALEEFKIQTSTYTAEFGRQPGGQVSLVTRSGTNKFHGTLSEYLRNDALDARDYFDHTCTAGVCTPATKPALRQNDFGGTFSGPIVKNKTFFFFSYEGQRLRLPLNGTTYVPSLRLRSEAAAAWKPILSGFPLPTGPEILTTGGLPSGFAPDDFGVSQPATLNATAIRIDHTVSSKLTLFGRFNESPSYSTTTDLPDGGGEWNVIGALTRTLTLGASFALTPQLYNELRFNYSRQTGSMDSVGSTVGGAVPFDRKLLTGGLGGYGCATIWIGDYYTYFYSGYFANNNQQQINVVDGISLVKGAHQFKFGVDYRRLAPTYGGIPGDTYEDVYSEASLISSISDDIYQDTHASAHPLFINFSAYGQDTWKVTPRLTLDLGLRWELNPAPSVPSGQMPPVVVGITNPPDVSNATLAPAGTPFYKTFYTAFAPRFGAAYRLHSTSGRETVLRGGFGVYYDLGSGGATKSLPLSAESYTTNVPFPLTGAYTVRPPIIIPTSLPVTVGVTSTAKDLKLPYTLQWNVALEQSLGTRQSLSASYVAAAGRRLLRTEYLNFPAGYTTGPRPNPNFARIFYTWNGPTSDYHSLQAQYQARLVHGVQALVSYTWSHAIDQVSGDIVSRYLLRGNADFDIRHNLAAAVTYNPPLPNAAPVLKQLFGNWSVDGIVHAQTGLPVDVTAPTSSIAGMMVYIRPDVVPGQPFYIDDPTVPGGRRFNAAAFTNPPADPSYPNVFLRQGDFGRNVLRELPLYQIDLALGRSFKLSRENCKLQFKGELFNILNHPMFAIANTNLNYNFPSTFGVPTETLRYALSTRYGAGLSSLYQMGGPRSVQLSLKLTF